jgi:hypothetical protein
LTACSTTELTKRATIPESLLQDCPVPKWEGKTYRDVIDLTERRRGALEDCNEQLSAAREYQRRVSTP